MIESERRPRNGAERPRRDRWLYSRDGGGGEEGAGEDDGGTALVEEKGRATFQKAAAAVVLVGNQREREERDLVSGWRGEVVCGP